MENDQRPTRRTDDSAEIPWARTTTRPPGPPVAPAPAGSAPAVAPPVRSGRRTAVAAALAIGFASVGAIGAAAALSAGSAQTGSGGGSPGGGQLPQGQPGQPGSGSHDQQLGSQDGASFSGPGGRGVPGQVPAVPRGDDDEEGGEDASTP